MATIKTFEELEIWQLARALSQEIFEIYTGHPEFARDFKLRDQVNASTGSIMDNIAEGFERNGRNEFIQFLSIAKGSAGEVQSQLYRMLDRKYILKEKFDDLYDKVNIIGKKIGSLISHLKSTSYKGTKFKDRQQGTKQDFQTQADSRHLEQKTDTANPNQ